MQTEEFDIWMDYLSVSSYTSYKTFENGLIFAANLVCV